MKDKFKIPLMRTGFLLCIAFNASISHCQKKTERTYPIPDNVYSILRPFCYSCHGPGGGRLPHTRLNFAAWNGYSPGKQAEKAASICSSMFRGTMPTKLWSRQNPALRLSPEQISIVCKWAEIVRLESEKSSRRAPGRKQRNVN